MKLIVGLGNPGKAYGGSRHNIGFSLVKLLAQDYRINLKRDNASLTLSGKGGIEDRSAILAMPRSFMNLSGGAVRALLKEYKVRLNELLVVYDDLDLDFGKIRVSSSGSSGGHKGLKSIIDSLNSQAFWRLRIGIGRPPPETDIPGYVLSPFSKKEKKQLKDIMKTAAEITKGWVSKKTAVTINLFNRRNKHE